MLTTVFHGYEDERITFDYPDGYAVTPSTDPGRFHFLVARPNQPPIPGLVIDVILVERDARAIETMLQAFKPLDMPTVRQVIFRRGFIQGPHFHGLEIWTATERIPAGRRKTSEWTIYMDFGGLWINFTLICDGELDQVTWSHVLYSIQPRVR